MNFTKTILEAIKYWINSRFSKVENELANKQPIGDYVLKSEISEQVQSDWSQNDEIAVSYIKNRPFYEEAIFETVIEEQNIIINEKGVGSIIKPKMGVGVYRVTFDGIVDDIEAYVSYELDDEEYCIKFFINDVPISMWYTPNSDYINISTDSSLAGEHTIKIEQKSTIIK